MTRVVVRADAGPAIGSGHVMRCVALIEALRARGADVELIGAGIPPAAAERLAAIGATSSGRVEADDLEMTASAARRGQFDDRWVVVDGYTFDRRYMQGLRDRHLRVAWIDDLNALDRFDCDLVLNPALGAERCAYAASPGTRVLLGASYSLLRQEFPVTATRQRAKASQIVVALGGADPGRLTPDVVRALRRADVDGCRAIVVVGPSNPHLDAVKAAASGATHITVVQSPPDLAGLLAESRLAITAAGTMTWELCALATPMMLLIVADNQLRGASAMQEARAADVIDARHGVDVDAVAGRITALWNDSNRLDTMAHVGTRIIDGRGAERAARWIVDGAQPASIAMRPARADDALQVWRINSEPSVRAQSFDPSPIPLDRHFDWFDRRLASAGARTYVFAREDELAAQIRYDRVDARAAELSFAVASPFRGLGLGTRVLHESWTTACADLRVPAVRGLVIQGNAASIAAFRRAGFRETGREERAGRTCLVFERRAA